MEMHDHRVCVGARRDTIGVRVSLDLIATDRRERIKKRVAGESRYGGVSEGGRSEVNVQGQSKQKDRSSVNGLGV